MDAALLDTDALNEVLKQKNAVVVQNAAQYLSEHGQFAISSISRYEVLRGLKEKNATPGLLPEVITDQSLIDRRAFPQRNCICKWGSRQLM
jgi:predicted nucleic acid-binding protein